MREEVRDRVVDSTHDGAPEDRGVLVRVKGIVEHRVADLFRLAALVLGFSFEEADLRDVALAERQRLADDLRSAARKLDRLAQETERANLEVVG